MLILYLVFGVLLIALAIPLLQEKVKPNWIYGFRVPLTIKNPHLWYPVNKFAAKRLIWAGFSLIVAAAILYFIPAITLDAYALGCLLIFMVVFGVGIVQSFQYLYKLAKQ